MLLKLLAPLFGFAVFGALFAALYYNDPAVIERSEAFPKFRLAPEAVKPDFIEAVSPNENVTVNITVLTGEVHVYVMDMENLSRAVQNLTSPGFDLSTPLVEYNATYSEFNVSGSYSFTFVSDGANRTAIVFQSAVPVPPGYENLSQEEREPYVTEIGVNIRYIDREEQTLLFAYVMAVPSILLVFLTLWLKTRTRTAEYGGDGLVMPRDQDL